MANSKIDKQMERMQFLMEYKNTPRVDTKAGIEYSINTEDGKTYGIIRENNMYYIKTTTPDKANIKESYEYIGGFNYRNEHGYKSYNEAAKHLELEIMCINEAFGKHEDVSVIHNPNRGEESMRTLTEEARTELNRMHQIFENSGNIGKYDVEGKGKASATDTKKNNAPFEIAANATLDKDLNATATVKTATPDYEEVKNVGAELVCDKVKTACGGKVCGEYEDAHSDIDGINVSEQKPQGGKAVMVNEDMEESEFEFNPDDFANDEKNANGGQMEDNENSLVGFDDETEEDGDINADMFGDEDEFDGETQLDEVLREFLDVSVGNNNDVSGNSLSMLPIPEEEEDSPEESDEEILEKMDRTIDRITNAVCESLSIGKRKETMNEKVDRIVKEELNAWGKHPSYQKPAFQTPENKEVNVNGSEDWDDESTKGSEAYGRKIGSGAPFDKKVTDILTDAVVKHIMENYGLKKK